MWGSLFVASILSLSSVRAQQFCGNTQPVWRNNNFTCPDRAICADVFVTTRNWYNGTRCEESRTLHNCLCPGGTVCPYNNPAHRFYASAQHLQYTCRATCTFPYCGSVRTGRPNAPVVSQTAEQNAAEFDSRTYYRMDCRCPRHSSPHTQTAGVHRAVHAYSHLYDYRQHRYSTQYVCTTRGNETQQSDPCGNSVQTP